MSPKSRGRPPGRGRSHQSSRRSAPGRTSGSGRAGKGISAWPAEEERADYWFDEPPAGDRRAWAAPPGHGTFRKLDLELLNPDDEDERSFLLEAQHPELETALARHEEIIDDSGKPMNPTLHVALHQIVANQLMADDPPEAWRATQRLAGLGYYWHNVMHMLMDLVSDDLYRMRTEKRPFDHQDWVRRLDELPGGWPSPEELGLR